MPYINTSAVVRQNTSRQISAISKEMCTGVKTSFKSSADIIIGNINRINHLIYKSSDASISNVISLLNTSHRSLNEMNNAMQELHSTYIYASTQSLPAAELALLENSFQTQILHLDQIANTAKYGSIALLDGSMDSATPLKLYTPDGNQIDITIPNMTNAKSPINNPGEDDLHIKLGSKISDLQATIPKDKTGDHINVTDNIKAFSGKDSLLYVVADQINKAFTSGLADVGNEYTTCIAQLQAVNWNTFLNPSDALAARNLINTPKFATRALTDGDNVINSCIKSVDAGDSQDEALYTAIDNAITTYIDLKYVATASNILSIASPDYFEAVGQRIKSAMNYIINAQINVNQQIKSMESLRIKYFEYSDQYGERADQYLNVDQLTASSMLNNLLTSQELYMDATLGFRANLMSVITDTANKILHMY